MPQSPFGSLLVLAALVGCSGESPPVQGQAGNATGGNTGGFGATGGTTFGGGGATAGGASAGSASLAGKSSTGGVTASSGAAGTTAGGAVGQSGGGVGGAGQGGASAGVAGLAGASGAGRGGAGVGGVAATGGIGGMAGSAGGGAGTAAGGTPSFAPCPATGPCNILPLGDSITDGFGTPGGYRIELFRLARADDKQFTFVGGQTNGPMTVDGQSFPRAHQGHSGWTIAQIDGIVPSPALGVNPHIILLHIGTNDMNGDMSSGAPARLELLIDQITAERPNALLVLSTIVPFPMRASRVEAFNAALPAIVSARAASGKHVILIDQFEGFPTNELADGIHPSPAGYARMAGAWYAAISSYLH